MKHNANGTAGNFQAYASLRSNVNLLGRPLGEVISEAEGGSVSAGRLEQDS